LGARRARLGALPVPEEVASRRGALAIASTLIRQIDVTDLPALRGLIVAFRDHLGAERPSSDELRAFLPAALRDPSTEFCLAFDDDKRAIGYAHYRFYTSIWALGTESHLEDLYVLPDFRNHGVGQQLMDFVINRARSRGAAALGLHTNENNRGAQAFYRRLGFEPRTEVAWKGGTEMYWGMSLRER